MNLYRSILFFALIQSASVLYAGDISSQVLHQKYLNAYQNYIQAQSSGASRLEIQEKYDAYVQAYASWQEYSSGIAGKSSEKPEETLREALTDSEKAANQEIAPSSKKPAGNSFQQNLDNTVKTLQQNTSSFLKKTLPAVQNLWKSIQVRLPSKNARNFTNKTLTATVKPLKNVKAGGTLIYSNIFESVIEPGILFSTLNKDGKKDGNAHLETSFTAVPGKPEPFDFFGHHRLGTSEKDENGNLIKHEFKGKVVTLMFNPGNITTSLQIKQNVTSSMKERGYLWGGGPGDLTASRIMRGINTDKTGKMTIPPGEFRIVSQWSGGFCETHNTQISGQVDQGQMQLVEIAVPDGVDLNKMTQQQLKDYIAAQKLHSFSPTDHPYVASGKTKEMLDLEGKASQVEIPKFMGRAGGITRQGAIEATADLFDAAKANEATYAINTTPHKSFGTQQMQSVKFDRYYDHKKVDVKTGLEGTVSSPYNYGNYGVRQTYKVPVTNSGSKTESVSLVLGCPTFNEGSKDKPGFRLASAEEKKKNGLPSYYLRTEVRVSYTGSDGKEHSQIVKVNQTAGQMSELLRLKINPREAKNLKVEMLGTGDSTPNQVLSIMKTSQLEK